MCFRTEHDAVVIICMEGHTIYAVERSFYHLITKFPEILKLASGNVLEGYSFKVTALIPHIVTEAAPQSPKEQVALYQDPGTICYFHSPVINS